jgi:hypothetical protein
MPKLLTKLRIDEISSVDRGAGEGCRIMLYKRDDDKPMFKIKLPKRDEPRGYLTFHEAMEKQILEKLSEVVADESDVRDEDSGKKISGKLRAMVDAMIVAVPSLDRQTAQHFLLHHPRGQKLAEHLNNLSKKDIPMLDIRKILPIIEEGLLAQAKLSKRGGESDAKAFDRLYMNDIEYRRKWASLTEMQQLMALTKSVNMMSTKPTSVEVGATNVKTDAEKAVARLTAMAEKQHRRFEEVFLDPVNAELAAATYRTSSVNTDYLET